MPTVKSGSLLNSQQCPFSVPNAIGPQRFLLCPAEMTDACLNYIYSMYTTLSHSTAAKVSDLNSYFSGNAVPNSF